MSEGTERHPRYSAIVLLEDQDSDLIPLVDTLHRVFSSRPAGYEIIIVANGVGGFLRRALASVAMCNGALKAYEFPSKVSQSVCLKAGFEESSGEIIIVCGSHRQITESSLMRLLDSLDEQTDIVNSWRTKRNDSTFNQLQSRAFNALVRKIARCQVHDLSSAVKVYRRSVLEQTDFYGNMHRFLPIIAEGKGFRTKEVECEHYRWTGKTGPCPPYEYIERVADLLTLYFLIGFKNKPLRFFNVLGTFFLLLGFGCLSYVFLDKMLLGHPVGGHPLLLLSLFSMVLGVQVSSVGLLGEIIAFTHGRHKRQYTIEKIL
ncbi:MAG: glycosyltransferase [Desulfosoma sp.]